jgi:hypothetical protein
MSPSFCFIPNPSLTNYQTAWCYITNEIRNTLLSKPKSHIFLHILETLDFLPFLSEHTLSVQCSFIIIVQHFALYQLLKLIQYRIICDKLSLVLRYRLDDQTFESWQEPEIIVFTTASIPVLGPTQPPIQWVKRAASLEVKRTGREADH